MPADDDLERAWASITGWLQDHAPATASAIRGPASAQELADAQQETGRAWPADVVAFYRLCDGTERSTAGYLLPGFCPLPLHGPHQLESVSGSWAWRQEWLADQARQWAAQPADPREENLRQVAGLGPAPNPFDPTELEAAPAGTQAMLWLPSWLPIAEDQRGSELVIDRRGGEQYGCALTVDVEVVDESPKRWASLGALLAAVAEAMSAGAAVAGTRYGPRPLKGELHWERVASR